MSVCLEARAVLVPVSVIGAEEVHPVIGRATSAGRLLGLPYVPITPTFPVVTLSPTNDRLTVFAFTYFGV